jgi:putative PIN family toxin of toxin-antitoxin system
VLDGRVELMGSPMLLTEIASVLGRPRLRRYLSIDEAARFIDDLASQATLAHDAPSPHPAVCRDSHDDYLVALAVATGADLIVTGDRDLLELTNPPVAVVTPRAFVERLDVTP